jgi:hypothetical protein
LIFHSRAYCDQGEIVMIAEASENSGSHAPCMRRELRTNMFVLASLVASGVHNRIKIRNLSPSGAMVEGPVLPRVGMQVNLCRAELTLQGWIVWAKDGRAGIRFHSRTVVSDWLPTTNNGQRAVDQAVALAQAERSAGLAPRAAAPLAPSLATGEDLRRIALLLDQLADEMADDPACTAKFMTKLQALDLASQALRRYAREAR